MGMIGAAGLNAPAPYAPDVPDESASSIASTLSQMRSYAPPESVWIFVADTSWNARGSPVTGHSVRTIDRGTKIAKRVSKVISPCLVRLATFASVAL